MQFTPASINVKVGDTVVWTNNDDRDHTVVADDGSFKSGNLGRGAIISHSVHQGRESSPMPARIIRG